MKRLILLATMVAVLASCEKTEIQNEVMTPIGFSSNVGKQTKAIVDGTTYPDSQPFAVLAYSHQDNTVTKVMDNVEIRKQGEDWKASSGKYYWPNDDKTTMNFYAYSPAIYATDKAPTDIENHMKMNGTITADATDANGINITGYTHTNMYVDFMVADNVTGATYSDQNGNDTGTPDKVPVVFKHKMTQILFNVKLNAEYTGVTFTLNSITLKEIQDQGVVTSGDLKAKDASTTRNYVVFPAKATTDSNGAPGLPNDQTGTLVLSTTATGYTTSGIMPVTMIPQEITGKKITVVYSISGTGVATETVTKTIDIPSSIKWEANKKIIYGLTIGLNEILFEPSIIDWDSDHNDNDTADDDINVNITQ